MASSAHPLVHEDGHILSGDGEDSLVKDVSTDQHVRPQATVDFCLSRVRRQRQLFVEHLQKSGCISQKLYLARGGGGGF